MSEYDMCQETACDAVASHYTLDTRGEMWLCQEHYDAHNGRIDAPAACPDCGHPEDEHEEPGHGCAHTDSTGYPDCCCSVRDCPHGRQRGKCDTCDLLEAQREIERLTKECEDTLAAALDLQEHARKHIAAGDDACAVIARQRAQITSEQSERARMTQELAALRSAIRAALAELKRPDGETRSVAIMLASALGRSES